MTQHEDRKDREARIANQQAEYELLKQEVKEAAEIYQWQIQVGAWEGKSGRYMLNGMAIFIVLMGLLVGWGLTDKNGWTGFWIVGIWGGIMASFIRFLWFADYHYHYHLTEKGIYYTCQQVISENAYTVVRITAWVGIAVCVLAAALIGPLAFVGAGAFALMSFSMTNFSAETISIGIRFDGCYRIVHLKDQEVIRLYNDTRKRYSTGGIFCSPDEKFHLIQLLKSQLPDVKILEAKRYKEVLNPSMISPDETSAS